jgi:trk system potassium uptake protein TrkH
MSIRLSRDKITILSYFSGIILAGSFLLMLPVSWKGPAPLSYIDALFTSTSAVCVTGLITVDTALYSRFGQAVIAGLIQFGGLGIITFATIYVALPNKRISLVNRSMIRDLYLDEVEHNPKAIVRDILVATVGIEAIGFIFLLFRFGSLPDGAFIALFHAISAFCNAGFSTFSTSLEAYVADPLVTITIMCLIVLGGLGFIVLRDLAARARGRKRRLSTHSRVVLAMTAFLVFGGAAVFLYIEGGHSMRGLGPGAKVLAAFFQSVTPRTAGFDTIATNRLSDASVLITIILMFIGASPGSTGGGVKTTTFFILVMTALRGVDDEGNLALGKRSIGPGNIIKALRVLAKGVLIVLLSTTLVLVFERGPVAAGVIGLTEVLFEVVSAFGTVGLSLGITSSLLDASKLVIILTMFAGRIGLFAMSLPAGERRIERYARLPESDLLIG